MYSNNSKAHTPYTTEQYLETEVLSASPARLVQMLYESAIQSISAAMDAIDAGDIALRSQKIGKAVSIVNELATSLDKEKAGTWARDLVELYDYMARQLNQANFNQSKAPLVEVQSLLGTLLEAWKSADHSEDESNPDVVVAIDQVA